MNTYPNQWLKIFWSPFEAKKAKPNLSLWEPILVWATPTHAQPTPTDGARLKRWRIAQKAENQRENHFLKITMIMLNCHRHTQKFDRNSLSVS